MTHIKTSRSNITLPQKDFTEVMRKFKQMKRKNLWSKALKIGGAAFAIFVLGSMFLTKKEPGPIFTNKSYHTEYDSYVPHQKYTVTLRKKDTSYITTTSGATIKIPPQTLINKHGEPIKGKVEMVYREFKNKKDLLLGGIPMEYDSGNTKYTFESAGMFEILAYQNGNPVFIAPHKSLEVNIISNDLSDRFNIYYFNAQNKAWEYKGKDPTGSTIANNNTENTPSQTIHKLQDKLVTINAQIQNQATNTPIKPQQLNPQKPNFLINASQQEFPELSYLSSYQFQVAEQDTVYKKEYAKEIWESVTINTQDQSNLYQLCFYNKSTKQKCFLCEAAIPEKDYASAIASYNRIINQISERKNNLIKQKKELEANIERETQKLKEEQVAILQTRIRTGVMETQILRTFQVAQFGVWNSDCPSSMPSGANILAHFKNPEGKPIRFKRIYLVEENKNAVYNLYTNGQSLNFSFDPKAKNMIWAITPDHEVAYISKKQFEEVDPNKNEHVFTMSLKNIESFKQLNTKQILAL